MFVFFAHPKPDCMFIYYRYYNSYVILHKHMGGRGVSVHVNPIKVLNNVTNYTAFQLNLSQELITNFPWLTK